MLDGKSVSNNDLHGKSCLLIDDDEDDKEIFCIALSEVDPEIKCLTAIDAIEALHLLRDPSFIPDYIFLDLNMPLMSGKECLIEIKKLPHLRETPVIIFTTSASQKDVLDTQDLGAASFITKPPLISTLTERLRTVMSGLRG